MRYHRRRNAPVAISDPPRVVVVGHCASGKSTLITALRAAGIDAVASAQEHSAIADLWKRSSADLLVYLDVDLETVRVRRGRHWPEAIFAAQEERLALARASADIEIDTSHASVDDVLAEVRTRVENWRRTHE